MTDHLAAQFEGQILDAKSAEPVPFATIYVLDHHTGTIADSAGYFSLSGLAGNAMLQVSATGYATLTRSVDLSADGIQAFQLEPSHLKLDEVVVSVPGARLQANSIVSIARSDLDDLKHDVPGSLAEALAALPGVENLSSGSGIGKPVIRGLAATRVVTYAQGVRVENQQWGDEHGLGVADAGIGSVEVIKGPASLLYGADALGGVLYLVDERYANQNTFGGQVYTQFNSSTMGTINHAGFKLNSKGLKWNLFGGISSNADYALPGGEHVFNTRFHEAQWRSALGYSKGRWIGNLRYSFVLSDFGITESDSTVGLSERVVDVPHQRIGHHLVSVENIVQVGRSRLSFMSGFNRNSRREFSEDTLTPGLDMNLVTATMDFKWSVDLRARLRITSGFQGLMQQNQNRGHELLIPDARTADAGLFSVWMWALGRHIDLQVGLRFDCRSIRAFKTETPTQQFPSLNRSFYSVNFSAGGRARWRRVSLRANVASGFRAPTTSELLSNGVHEGTNRHEIGDSTLKSERGLQLDVTAGYETEHFSFFANPYVNRIARYVFLNPTDSVIGGLKVYTYTQANVWLYGAEAGVHWHPHPVDWLHLESTFESVVAQAGDGDPLPLIPAHKVVSTVKAEVQSPRRLRLRIVAIEHVYRFKQDRVAAFEQPTPGYHLINVRAEAELKSKRSRLSFGIGVKNLLNAEYFEHLSRLRSLGLPQPGRSVFATVRVTFE